MCLFKKKTQMTYFCWLAQHHKRQLIEAMIHSHWPKSPVWATLWWEARDFNSPLVHASPVSPRGSIWWQTCSENPKLLTSLQLAGQIDTRNAIELLERHLLTPAASIFQSKDGLSSAAPRSTLPCRWSSGKPSHSPCLPPLCPPRLPLRHPRLAPHHEGAPWQVVGREGGEG